MIGIINISKHCLYSTSILQPEEVLIFLLEPGAALRYIATRYGNTGFSLPGSFSH